MKGVSSLSTEEVKQRLIRLNNLEQMYPRAKKRIVLLEEQVKQLKQRIKELEDKNNDQNTKIEALSFQFEQIKNKLFGKKPLLSHIVSKKKKMLRDVFSYRRPIPTVATETKSHPVSECHQCHRGLKRKSVRIFFEEDIPLPIQKTVIRHEVEVGYCTSCKRQSSGIPVPSKKSVLGDNVKKYVCILSIANRLSHTQIQEHLKDVFNVRVSTGEIGNILQTEADSLRPEYQTLKESIFNQTGVHYDETGWKVQKEELGNGKYAWVATGTESNDTV